MIYITIAATILLAAMSVRPLWMVWKCKQAQKHIGRYRELNRFWDEYREQIEADAVEVGGSIMFLLETANLITDQVDSGLILYRAVTDNRVIGFAFRPNRDR